MTDLTVTGKVAQFGRGVLADVSAKLLGQFVDNLEATVLADELIDDAVIDLAVAATTDDAGVAGAAVDEAAVLLEVAEAVESTIDTTPVGEGRSPSSGGSSRPRSSRSTCSTRPGRRCSSGRPRSCWRWS